MTEIISNAQTRGYESTGTGEHTAWFSVTLAKSTAQAHGGTGSMSAASTDGFTGIQLTNWPGYTGLSAGTTYYYSAWLYKNAGPSGLTWTWDIRARTSGGADVTVVSPSLALPSAGVWVQLSGSYVPAATSTNQWWEWRTAGTSDASTVTYFDDLSISDVNPAAGSFIPRRRPPALTMRGRR